MSDDFKQAPIDQVRDVIQKSQQEEAVRWGAEPATFTVPKEKLRIAGHIFMPDGERREIIEKSLYIKALDEKQRAEELLEVAHQEILRLNTIISYLEARNGRDEKGTV